VKQRGLFEIVLPDAVRQITMSYFDFRPDVVHGHTFHGFGLGVFLKLMFRCPFVFTVSALFSQLEDAKADYLPEQFKQFHSGVDRFFTGYPEELLNIGVPAEKIVPLNVVVDLEEIRVVQAERDRHRAEVRKSAGIPENALVALSVGRLHPSKGHQYALEALAFLVTRFPDLHWILIGKASEEERAVVQARAIELGVDERVHILGFVEEPLPFYAAADIYLRTGIFEGDNLSSCQAMAMSLPVVGFETGTASELISTVGHGILVPPKDAAALSAAVQQILSLPDRGRPMGELAAGYCRTHLDIQRLVSMLTAVYADLREKALSPR
jgi:glycosyltransferase involved in cell wall biosynthesis